MWRRFVSPAIAIAAGVLMFGAGVGPADARSNVAEWIGTFAPSGGAEAWFLAVGGAVLIGVGAIWAYRVWQDRGRPPEVTFDSPLVVVRDRTFRNERVPLDGFEYIGCSFDHVTFVYEGKTHIRISRAYIGPFYIDISTSPAMSGLMRLLGAAGWLHPGLGVFSHEREQEEMSVAEVNARDRVQHVVTNYSSEPSEASPPPAPDASEGRP